MKTSAKRILMVFGLLQILSICANAELPRIRQTINDNWEYSETENEKGKRINLPHTWNIEDTFDDEPGYRRGAGWYRKELKISQTIKNKCVYLYFEGVNHTAEVFLNQKRVGEHIGGYTAFAFEITDLVEFENPNILTVKVDNTLDKDKPPIDGDFTMYGGIYRDVWLIAAEDVHFKITDYASSGITVQTPQVSNASADVKVSGTVVNKSDKAKSIEVTNTIFDKQNKQIISAKSVVSINPNSEANFMANLQNIKNPQLWSPDEPNLYRVVSVIYENGKLVDEVSNPLGFRWFRFDANEGFFLNGKHLKLRGTNRHQDYKGLGNAVPDSLQVRDLEIIKTNGFNFLRLAHYPQDASVLEAADRLGLLIWEEIPIVNQIHVSEKFNENARNMLTEMIRQHRNHPSIVLWGFMNEVFLPVPKTEEVTKATVNLAKELQQICKTEDPTRSTAIAFDWGARELYHTSGLGKVTDVIGWNLYHGWYYETFEDFGKFIDDQHRRFPDKRLIISEYGANGDQRLHSQKPKRFDSTIEWQRMYHESYLPQINARKFIAGSAIWNQFDFGSEFRGETIPHLNQKGLFSYDRQPKDISYFYKAHFANEPVLHIATRDWKYRSGNAKQTIDVYSNLPTVELFQDGASVGMKKVDGNKKASWQVNLKNGNNIFVAKSSNFTDKAEVFYTNPTNFNEIAVNVGSNAEFTDQSGLVWTADQTYQKGIWGFVGDEAKEVSTLRNALGTLDDPLFQTMLEGMSEYRFDAPDGDYEVELKFTESKFKESEQRVFGIDLNAQIVVENLDLAKENGLMQSVTKRFRVIAKDNSGVRIKFLPQVDKPILSGIRIKKIQ